MALKSLAGPALVPALTPSSASSGVLRSDSTPAVLLHQRGAARASLSRAGDSRRFPYSTREAHRMGRGSFLTVKAVAEEATVDAPVEDAALKEGIAAFYDESSAVWEEMWGEHMHHGYYPTAGEQPAGGKVDHVRAQIDMIDNVLAWATEGDKGFRPKRAVDVGCGIGGSSRHLARKYGCQVDAITLSPWQARRGNERCQEQGLDGQVRLQVADAMRQPFADGSFDLVWSLESGEHMPQKEKFVGELARVAAPGGRVIIVTWCHRNLDVAAGETELKADEKALLQRICDAYYLPAWCSPDDYVQFAKAAGLENIRTADWSEHITPFWPAVIASALTLRGFMGLLKSGWKTMLGAVAMVYMVQGFNRGLIKFALITAEKPREDAA
eukprot:TRINITY_DN51871_c0_g1_i1.p1 TRINITY_DN51871_c0_g1~~TRINITY_DN51871_c0_g1_i1.p1  ORF type:complete len:384 (-),score=-3.94 TRINITY_DN51871_c0_g1_i1:188-1339(-)